MREKKELLDSFPETSLQSIRDKVMIEVLIDIRDILDVIQTCPRCHKQMKFIRKIGWRCFHCEWPDEKGGE